MLAGFGAASMGASILESGYQREKATALTRTSTFIDYCSISGMDTGLLRLITSVGIPGASMRRIIERQLILRICRIGMPGNAATLVTHTRKSGSQ